MTLLHARSMARLLRGAVSAALALATLGGVAGRTAAQEEPRSEPRNTVTVSIGRSRLVTEEGGTERIPAIGADYLRVIGRRWEIGAQLDVDFDRDSAGVKAVLVTPVVAFSIFPRWPVFAGVGAAFEGEEDAAFYVRLGTEYLFPLDRRRRWFIAPGGFVDLGHEVTPSLMIAVGHSF